MDYYRVICKCKKIQTIHKLRAVTTRDIIFTIPETLEIIRKPGKVICQTVIMAAYKIGLLTICGIKKQKGKTTCKTLGQYRLCLINEILTNPAPLQSCGCQIKEILLYKLLNLSGL